MDMWRGSTPGKSGSIVLESWSHLGRFQKARCRSSRRGTTKRSRTLPPAEQARSGTRCHNTPIDYGSWKGARAMWLCHPRRWLGGAIIGTWESRWSAAERDRRGSELSGLTMSLETNPNVITPPLARIAGGLVATVGVWDPGDCG